MIEVLSISKNYYRVILFSPRGKRDNSDNRAQDAKPYERPTLIVPVDRTLAIIMGGGASTRLFPLTKERAKPAVRLVANIGWLISPSATV